MVGLVSALLCLGALGVMGTTVVPAAAQEICADQPGLAVVDANKDGVASVDEILAVAPDNTQVQEVIDQLEAQDITGIRYTGCDESTPGQMGVVASPGASPVASPVVPSPATPITTTGSTKAIIEGRVSALERLNTLAAVR